MPTSYVSVQHEDFDAADLGKQLSEGLTDVGAISTFIGLVRDVSDAKNVKSLTLEHYPGMTEKSMEKIVRTALERWPVLRIIALHRVGKLNIGEQIVYVGVSSMHRKAAIAACEYVIDQLKTKAVIWKKEETTKGEQWLLPTEEDSQIADSYLSPHDK